MCRGLESLPTLCLEWAKELRAHFGNIRHKQELCHFHRTSKQMMASDEPLKWRESFQDLLSNKHGLCAFSAFLVSEYSAENMAFYLACEDYINTKSSSKLPAKARKIYDEFIGSEAPREVNLDHETKNVTKKNLEHPTHSCFDLARSKIYSLMEKDCYPRFLKSAAYKDLSRQLAG
ncbi:regulator of G-protein signaling 5b [Denticeps clupeoides]|uniref:RGS domain-containing protein n=1 Tax=Denticeps clupeoides TaxID=299321 RepID=A0AAY4ABP1_9TELE|nr:regulator of G-protein signaling 16-like [Denticeps clupeoides]